MVNIAYPVGFVNSFRNFFFFDLEIPRSPGSFWIKPPPAAREKTLRRKWRSVIQGITDLMRCLQKRGDFSCLQGAKPKV
jgi:hypothetical protein